MIASQSCRSWSRCQSSTASPTRDAALTASTSSQDPGNWMTPNFTRTPRETQRETETRSRSPRPAGWPAAARTSPGAAPRPRRRARRAARRARCARPRTRARAAPARRPGPAGRGSPPWAGSAPGPSRRHPLKPGGERLAGELLVRRDVALAGRGHDVVGDRRRRRRLVPARARGLVAHVLLVERRLAAADLVPVRRPEARGVRRAHLVAEGQRAVRVQAELELRVGEDHAALPRMRGHGGVDRDGDVPEPRGELVGAHELAGPREVDRLVVPLVRLRRRCE